MNMIYKGVFNKMTLIESQMVMITAMKMTTTVMTSMTELPQISKIMKKYEMKFPIPDDIDQFGNGACLEDEIARYNGKVQRRENEELAINIIGTFNKEEDLRIVNFQETSENLVQKVLAELELQTIEDLMLSEWESQPQKLVRIFRMSANHFKRESRLSVKIWANAKNEMRKAITNKKMEEANNHALNTIRQQKKVSILIDFKIRFGEN
jgi:hypothetical protein